MDERPGIILYFNLLDKLDDMTCEEVGTIIVALKHYAKTGEEPAFEDRYFKSIWADFRAACDNDAKRYEERKIQSSYAAYCREEKKKGCEPVSLNDFRYLRISGDTRR